MRAILRYFGSVFLVCLGLVSHSAYAQSREPFRFPAGYSAQYYAPRQVFVKLKPATAQLLQGKAVSAAAYILPPAFASKWSAQSLHPFLSEEQPQPKNTRAFGTKLKALQAQLFVLEFAQAPEMEQVINELEALPSVEYAEPIYYHYPLIIPNDPLAQPNATNYHLGRIQAYQAWDIETGNPNVVIGITDNGFDLSNPDLNTQAAPLTNTSFSAFLGGASPFLDVADQDNVVTGGIHGSAVAYCASSRPNNGFGGAGVGYNCRFLPIKVARDVNNGVYEFGYQGILQAARQPNCRVVNMSWGRRGLASDAEREFLEAIVDDFDVVLVAAAGNDNNTAFFYPASYPSAVLSVAATNNQDFKAGFSSYNALVGISAPGEGVTNVANPNPGSNGTSFAAPLVSGAAALVRSRYPTWTARQVIARLQTTTDYIDNLSGNAAFQGKLGTGRLNVYQALIAPTKAITLQDYELTPNVRGYAYAGQLVSLRANFRNHLDALSNLSITISSSSPFITLIDNQANIGAVGANAAFNNQTDAFVFRIADNTPANTAAVLRFTYTDGAYTRTEERQILLNAAYSDINLLRVGFNDLGNTGVYDNTFSVLSGVSYGDTLMLTEAGFLLGISPDTVSSAVRNELGMPDRSFAPKRGEPPVLGNNGNSFITTIRYDDQSGNPRPIGVEITQKSYAWNEAGLRKALVVEYQVKNLTDNTIPNLFPGLYVNWNINNPSNNRASWMADSLLAFTFDAAPNGLYGGIRLLTNQVNLATPALRFQNHCGFENLRNDANQTVVIADGFTRAEKYQVLSGQMSNTSVGFLNGATDVSQVLSTRLTNLRPGEVRSVAWVWAVGNNFNDLLANTSRAAARYKGLRTGAIPDVANATLCAGASYTLRPSNGNRFNFYTSPPTQAGAVPAYTGNSLQISNIQVPITLYVSNIDSVYESAARMVVISPSVMQANFSLANTEIDITEQLTLSDASAGGVSRTWAVTRLSGNTPNSFSFVGGTNASSANAQLRFNTTGIFRITLRSVNALGCTDSLSRTVTVFENVTALSEWLDRNTTVSPNPTTDLLQVQLPEGLKGVQIDLLNPLGQSVAQLRPDAERSDIVWRLSHLPAGVYVLRIREARGEARRKIVKW